MLLALSAALPAQNLTLDKQGGAIGDLVHANVHGNPAEPYIVLFDFIEQQTPIPSIGVTLDITDTFAGASFVLPGFFSTTNAQGDAVATLLLPNDPGLAGLRISLQAVAGFGPFRVSNLTRLTPQAHGTFAPTLQAPASPLAGGAVVAESNGNFLFAGGSGPVAQRYSERLEEWSLAGASFGVGLFSQATALANGQVLFTGGLDLLTGTPSAAAAVYDPATQQTTTLLMLVARAGHGASLMGNGKVLITGGSSGLDLQNPLSLFTGLLNSTEIFDPATGTFTAGPTMLEPRAFHSSTTLTNGQVLIAGGLSLLPIVSIPNVSATAYKFNPTTNSFGLPAAFSGGRFLHSAVALSNGKVLLVGGISLDLSVFLTTLNIQDIIVGTRTDGQVYTASLLGFGTFATVNGMQEGRAGAAVAPLPNGGALVAGGFQLTIDIPNSQLVFNATATADVFTQSPNAFAPTGSMAAPRAFPVTANLPDGTILVTGGGVGTSEVFQR